jgi:hypothetical protein
MKTAAAFAFLCLVAHVGVAQQLRGVVRDSTSGTPIPGVVLLLLDSSGAVVGRNITNESGQYAVTRTSALRRVRLLRIGFRPRVVAIPEETAGVTRLDATMVAIPTLLKAVSVVDQPKCPARADRAAALSLWEQAKAALLATVVARDVNPAQMMRLNTDRRMDRQSDTTDRLEVRIDSAATSHSFIASHTAPAFLERGFVDDNSSGTRTFHGPDADVMLDDAFPLGYCFEIARPDPTRPHEVGLGFRPATRSRDRIDIEGAVWIDSVSRSLTDIVFRYVGLDPRYSRYGAGGRVSFRSMPDGTAIVDRWHIRMLTVPTDTASTANSPAGRDRVEIHERGGELAHARWPDGHEWNAALGTIAGFAEYRDGPAAHARMRLLNTDYEVVTDSVGAFRIPDLVPGPYHLEVLDSVLAPLGLTLRTPVTFSAVRDSVIVRTVRLPTARDYIRMRCEAGHDGGTFGPGTFTPGQDLPRTGQMIVRVMAPDGTPVSGARYEVSGEFDGGPPLVGRTDEQGVFVLCSVQSNQGYTLSARYRSWKVSAFRTAVQGVEAIRLEFKEPQQ